MIIYLQADNDFLQMPDLDAVESAELHPELDLMLCINVIYMNNRLSIHKWFGHIGSVFSLTIPVF